MIVTKEQYFWLINLYNSKKREFNRNEFCEIINISTTNSKSYNQIINLLKEKNIVVINESFRNQIKIVLDRTKLERLIRKSIYYKLTDDFIHKSTFGAITG